MIFFVVFEKRKVQPIPLRAAPAKSAHPIEVAAQTSVYRPFFFAGILSVLTAGCLLGAVALLGISFHQNYTLGAWSPYILAHANSQVYGWVGFFIMGFALQQHSPSLAKVVLFYRLAFTSLVLMALGIALRFAAEPLSSVEPETWIPVGVLSTVMQAIAVTLFIINIRITRFVAPYSAPAWQTRFVFLSLFWWLVVAFSEPFYFLNSHQSDNTASIMFIAKWFPPYRDAQFLGFVSMMIFGVAFSKLHSCFGFEEAERKWGHIGLSLWTIGLLMRIVGWLRAFDADFSGGSKIVFNIGSWLLLLGAIFLVWNTKVFSMPEITLPSHKFLRAAFSWLLVGGVLMVLEPFHLQAIGAPFSHAYVGAIRHALTVGFISQMIIGVSLLVVSRMNDLDPTKLSNLWSVFWLLNLGNASRVFLEIGTDYSSYVFLPMGLTGFIELLALGIWAWNILLIMLRKPVVSYAN